MPTYRLGRSLLPTLALTLSGLAAACDSAQTTGPNVERLKVPSFANGTYVERGTFTIQPPPLPINASCVDPDNQLQMLGTWSGWYNLAQTANGHLHITEHVDWSDVTLVAVDGRTWKPGPGAHESFSFNEPATADDLGERGYTVMHNLRARFNSQDGDSDLQVWHTIHIVRGPDLELRVFRVVFPFEAECVGPQG